MKIHRESECDCCGSDWIETTKQEILLSNGKIEEVYNERCANCKNLLYGYSKPLK